MRLLLARHGETKENEEGTIQGRLPGTLTKKGEDQAHLLAQACHDLKIDKIFFSPLHRAAATAKIVAQELNIPAQPTAELMERSMGVWEGKRKKDLGLPAFVMGLPETPEGGETLPEVYERVAPFLERVGSGKTGTYLVIAHNGIVKALVAHLRGLGAEDIPSLPDYKNASIIDARKERDGWNITILANS